MSRKNHQGSIIASFHGKLAGSKGLDFDNFAVAISKAAAGLNGSHEYIKAILYGRKPMPSHWKNALVAVVGISVKEYDDRLLNALKSATDHDAKPSDSYLKLPTNFWPHFTWQSKFTAQRKIATRLYGLSKTGLTPQFCVISGQWQAPAGFTEYHNLRDEAWMELVQNYSRMKKEPPNPKNCWHVEQIVSSDDSFVKMDILQADYRDILVTATQKGLEHFIQNSNGNKCTVRQWLASAWKSDNPSEPVLPGSRQVVVNLMVVTKDGSVVLSRQGPDSPESSGSWATSVSSVLNPKTDCDSQDVPDLARAASRSCKEELNMDTDGTTVRWLTIAVGLKLGSHTIFGLLETDWTKEKIQRAVSENVESACRDATRVCQVVEVDFLKLSPESVAQRLKRHDYRPYLELGLALLLWRNGEAQIIDGIQTGFGKTDS